jgi:hypothetical protein
MYLHFDSQVRLTGEPNEGGARHRGTQMTETLHSSQYLLLNNEYGLVRFEKSAGLQFSLTSGY